MLDAAKDGTLGVELVPLRYDHEALARDMRADAMAALRAERLIRFAQAFLDRYDTVKAPFGNAAQPFWVDGRIVLNIAGKQAGIVAVDAATGETAWTATDHQAGYASPVLAEIAGMRRLLFFTRVGLVDLWLRHVVAGLHCTIDGSDWCCRVVRDEVRLL